MTGGSPPEGISQSSHRPVSHRLLASFLRASVERLLILRAPHHVLFANEVHESAYSLSQKAFTPPRDTIRAIIQ